MAESAGLELLVFGEALEATAWLDKRAPHAVVVDLRVAGVNDVCRKVRSRRQLCSVPIIALTRQLTDGETARFLAVGVDEVLPFSAGTQLFSRLGGLSGASLKPPPHQGVMIVAEAEPQRADVFGRVFMNAGYDIKYAVDDRSVLFYERDQVANVIVLGAKICEPRALIEEARALGSQAVWVVNTSRRELEALTDELADLEGVAVVARDAPPTDALFFANELRLPPGARQRKGERRLYGTEVRFRDVGGAENDFGFSYNISDSGIYVRTLAPPVSERVWLEVRPPSSQAWAVLEVEVVWRRPFASQSSAAVPPGFGAKIHAGLGQSLLVWKRAVRDFSRASAPRAGGGLASLVNQTLQGEGLLPLIDEPALEPAPAWGAEDEEVSTLDGLVTAGDSWEPVTDADQIHSVAMPLPEGALPLDLTDLVELEPLGPPPLPAGKAEQPPPLPGVAGHGRPVPPQLPVAVAAAKPTGRRLKRSHWMLAAAGVVLVVGATGALALSAGGVAGERATLAAQPPRAAVPKERAPKPQPESIEAVLEIGAAAPADAAPAARPNNAQPPDNSDLKPNEGGLIVNSAPDLKVFIQGVERGVTNKRLILPCGYRYVRLQGQRAGTWVSEGLSVLVTCRATTEVELPAKPAG